MATKLFYGHYWADIRPVRSQQSGAILYWKYKVFEILSDHFQFEGLNANLDSARNAAEAYIDRRMADYYKDHAA